MPLLFFLGFVLSNLVQAGNQEDQKSQREYSHEYPKQNEHHTVKCKIKLANALLAKPLPETDYGRDESASDHDAPNGLV